MTLLGRYLEAARQPDAEQAGAGFDVRLVGPDGALRPAGPTSSAGSRRRRTTSPRPAERSRGCSRTTTSPTRRAPRRRAPSPTRRPIPPPAPAALEQPRPWQLDPLPLVLDEREWATLEAGVVQRAELLDAVLADLYGARRLLARG